MKLYIYVVVNVNVNVNVLVLLITSEKFRKFNNYYLKTYQMYTLLYIYIYLFQLDTND